MLYFTGYFSFSKSSEHFLNPHSATLDERIAAWAPNHNRFNLKTWGKLVGKLSRRTSRRPKVLRPVAQPMSTIACGELLSIPSIVEW